MTTVIPHIQDGYQGSQDNANRILSPGDNGTSAPQRTRKSPPSNVPPNGPTPLQAYVNTPVLYQTVTPQAGSSEFNIAATVTLDDGATVQIDTAIVEYFIEQVMEEWGIAKDKISPDLHKVIRAEAIRRAILFYVILREALLEMSKDLKAFLGKHPELKAEIENAMAEGKIKVLQDGSISITDFKIALKLIDAIRKKAEQDLSVSNREAEKYFENYYENEVAKLLSLYGKLLNGEELDQKEQALLKQYIAKEFLRGLSLDSEEIQILRDEIFNELLAIFQELKKGRDMNIVNARIEKFFKGMEEKIYGNLSDRDRETIRNIILSQKIHKHFLGRHKLSYNHPALIAEMLAALEQGIIPPKEWENVFGILDRSINSLPDGHPDKAFFLASYAFLRGTVGRIDKKGNLRVTDKDIEAAKKLFEKAKSMNGTDLRILFLEAKFYATWGEYEKALELYDKIYYTAKKDFESAQKVLEEGKGDLEAAKKKRQEALNMLHMVSTHLVLVDAVICSDFVALNTPGEKALHFTISALNFGMNPVGFIGSRVNDLRYNKKKKHKPEDLEKIKVRTRKLATKSIKTLSTASEAINDPRLIIDFSRSVLAEYHMRSNMLEQAYLSGQISEKDYNLARESYTDLFFYYYPEAVERAIKIAIKTKDVAALAFIVNDLSGVIQSTSDMSSYGLEIRNKFADIAEKAIKEIIELADAKKDKKLLMLIGTQALLMDKADLAIKVFEKLTGFDGFDKVDKMDPELRNLLRCVYLALGRKKEALKILGTLPEFESIEIESADSVDPLEIQASIALMGGDPQAIELAVLSVYRRNGYRLKTLNRQNGSKVIAKVENGVLKLKVEELKIGKVRVDVSERQRIKKKGEEGIISWISYVSRKEVSPGQLFNQEELENSVSVVSRKLGTFSPRGWRIVETKKGAVIMVDITEGGVGYLDLGYQTSVSGPQVDIGKVSLGFRRMNSGRNINFGASGGRMGDETVFNGSISYYDPHLTTIHGNRIFSNISVFKQSYLDYFEERVDTKIGGRIRLGTDIGKNTTAWIEPWGYGLQESGSTIYGMYAGITYDTRRENRGNYFSIYAGPGFGPDGAFWKAMFDGRKYVPLPKGAVLALRVYGGVGDVLPGSEALYLGNDPSFWRGRMDSVLMGNGLIGGSAEIRTKKYMLHRRVGLQPYIFVDSGTAFDWDNARFRFLPVGGFGLRLYLPGIGCVNLYYGWPLGKGLPHFGFTIGENAVY